MFSCTYWCIVYHSFNSIRLFLTKLLTNKLDPFWRWQFCEKVTSPNINELHFPRFDDIRFVKCYWYYQYTQFSSFKFIRVFSTKLCAFKLNPFLRWFFGDKNWGHAISYKLNSCRFDVLRVLLYDPKLVKIYNAKVSSFSEHSWWSYAHFGCSHFCADFFGIEVSQNIEQSPLPCFNVLRFF